MIVVKSSLKSSLPTICILTLGELCAQLFVITLSSLSFIFLFVQIFLFFRTQKTLRLVVLGPLQEEM